MSRVIRKTVIIAIVVAVSLMLLISGLGCSSAPKLGPQETVREFFKLVLQGDTEGAMKYVQGVDWREIERRISVEDRGEEAREKFMEYCTSELLEEGERQAKVRWHIDFKALDKGKIIKEMGYEKSAGAKYLQEFIDKRLEAVSTIDFTLRKRRGRWLIVAVVYPEMG